MNMAVVVVGRNQILAIPPKATLVEAPLACIRSLYLVICMVNLYDHEVGWELVSCFFTYTSWFCSLIFLMNIPRGIATYETGCTQQSDRVSGGFDSD